MAQFYINKQGTTIVEALVVIALLSIISLGFIRWLANTHELSIFAGNRARAALIAQEGLEAARSIRDSAYNNLTVGTHGIALSGGSWSFSGTSDTTDTFTRIVTVSSVDADTKQVQSQVTWDQTAYRAADLALMTYLTNWQSTKGKVIPIIPDATLDLAGPADGREVALFVSGSNTYVALGRASSAQAEFYMIDVTTPSTPSVVGSLEIGSDVNGIAIVGTNAYLATSSNSAELQVVSIATPSSPTLIGSLNISSNADAQTVTAAGSNLYLGTSSNSAGPEIRSVSIATPSAPSEISSLEIGDSVWKMTLAQSNQYVYAATGLSTAELAIVNVISPGSISLAGSLNVAGVTDGTAVAAFSTYAALGMDNGVFYVVNVATPSSPLLYSSAFDVGVKINDLTMGVDDEFVFAGSGTIGSEVTVIEITDLTTPVSFFSVDLAGNEAMGVVWDAGLNRVFGGGRGNTEEFFVLIP